MRMKWKNLLSTKRVSEFCGMVNENKSQFEEIRSPFEEDCNQLIYSYAFRRLQDKTQVIPFPKLDFVHTRLTHSLEVANIGRALGKKAFKLISKEEKLEDITAQDIGALLAASCYAHDIGNPPFGHSGEESIGVYFDTKPEWIGLNIEFYFDFNELKNKYEIKSSFDRYVPTPPEAGSDDLSTIFSDTKMLFDLKRFEGNANGFRILTNNCGKGIDPTYALLGVFTKYPRESFISEDINNYEGKTRPKHMKKFGFFQAERDFFLHLVDEIGLIKISKDEDDLAYCRHPLAYLMEAADDIAYQMIDFEDGCRLDLIDYHSTYNGRTPREVLIKIAEIDKSFSVTHLENLCRNSDHKDELNYLRLSVIDVLTNLCFEVFAKNYDDIMEGKFNSSLIESIENEHVIAALKYMRGLIVDKIYVYRPVLELEAAGFQILEGLLASFAKSAKICVSCGDRKNAKEKKIESLIPIDYRPKESSTGQLTKEEIYNRYLRITDYISGMTDKYALDLYRKLRGISIN